LLIERQQVLDKVSLPFFMTEGLQLNSILSAVDGWEEFVDHSTEERMKYGQTSPDDSDDEDSSNSTTSLSEYSEDSNDANDYDTSQAEILLTKAEIEAAA
jgi:hypothetical protein